MYKNFEDMIHWMTFQQSRRAARIEKDVQYNENVSG